MRLRRGAVAGVAVAAVLAGAVVVSPRAVLGRLETLAARPVLFGVAVAALYLLRPVLAWPTMLCSAVVGYGYGLVGLPVALLGAGITSLPPYYATRYALGDGDAGDHAGALGWIVGPLDRARGVGRDYFAVTGGVRGVVAARLAPIPADLVTCGAAASDLRVRTLFVGTLLGELPWTVAAVGVGASAGGLAAENLTGVGLPLVLAGVALAVALLAGPAYRRFLGETG